MKSKGIQCVTIWHRSGCRTCQKDVRLCHQTACTTVDFQLEFTLLNFALPRHTQASAAISPIAGGMVRGHQAYPHTDGPACRTTGGQTSSESLQSRLGPCGAQLTCVATRRHYMGLDAERLFVLTGEAYALGFLFALLQAVALASCKTESER